MKTRSPSPRLVLAAGLLTLPLGTPAAEADARPAPEATTATVELDPVTVVGTREKGYRATTAPTISKSDTPLKETPFSEQVVTRELIEDRGVVTFGEAVRTVPGLNPQVGFAGTNDRFRLRGFPTTSNLKNGLRRSVFIPIDELANVEQIEVLKGPASSLYGRFEPGGVVNIVTKKPLRKARTEVELTGGSYDFYRGTLDASGPLSDNLGYRLTGALQDNDSFRDFINARTRFVSPVLAWRPGPATEVVAEIEYLHRDQAPDRGFGNNAVFLTVPIERNYGEPYTRLTNASSLASLRLTHALSPDWGLRVGVQGSQGRLTGDYVAYGFPAVLGATGPNPVVRRQYQPVFDRERDGTVQAELTGRLDGLGVEQRVLLGAEVARTREDASFRFAPLGSISLRQPVYGQQPGTPGDSVFRTRSDTLALYAQDEVVVSPQWRLVGGLRFDALRYTSADTFVNDAETGKGSDHRTTPRLGVTYTPAPAASFYANWARSFLPDVFARLADGSVPDSAEGEQYEVGAKLDLLDGRLTPTLALFRIERLRGAVADPNDPTFTFSVLAGEQRSKGIELDIPWAVTARWRLLASYTRLEAEFTEDPSLQGNRLANAPRNNASFWTTYDLPGLFQGLSLGTGLHYVGEREANNANTFRLPSYTRWDANVAYQFGPQRRYRVQVNAVNLTDKRYYDSGGSFVPTYPGAPLTVLGTLGVRF